MLTVPDGVYRRNRGRSILTGILSARNTGSLAIWFRHQFERGARALPLASHSVTGMYSTTAAKKMQGQIRKGLRADYPGIFLPPAWSAASARSDF